MMKMKIQNLFSVAVYIRLSREDGDKAESDSIGNQRKLISDYLKNKEDFILYDTYIDDGYTGTNFKRPAFQRMIEDIEAGAVNCVIVKDLSRFGRDYIDTGKFLERYFPNNDVRFIAITDNIDSMKQAYDMLLPIKNIFNEQYARDISKKVHSAMRAKQKAGEFIGAFASYGYRKSPVDKNKLVVDEYAAGIVRRVFQLYISGYGKIRIAGILNDEGIVCPSEYKRLNGENYRNCNRLSKTAYWTYSTINNILKNEMYCGNMVQHRTCQHMHGKARPQEKEEWIVIKGTHEAIIDEETWNTAQKLLQRRTRELDLNSNMSIFAGFLKCGDCGRALCKKNMISRGKKYVMYQCGTYVRSGRRFCTPHGINHDVLEAIVLDDLKVIIQNVSDLKEIVEAQAAEILTVKKVSEDEVQKLENELQKLKKMKKAVYEDYREELITKEEYISYRQDYQQKEDLYLKRLRQLQEQEEEHADANVFESPWLKRLLEFKEIEALDRDIIVEMVHEIKIYEDHKIVITYNFSNELENLFKATYTMSESIG